MTGETIAKINKTKSWFFETINKLDKPLARLIKKHTQNNKVNGNRIILISNYLKRKWVECPNQKTKTG